MMLKAPVLVRPLWYLASPYSKYPGGMDEAFEKACGKAGEMMLKGYAIFCPIAHSHPISKTMKVDTQVDHDFWLGQDVAVMDKCEGIFVYMLPGWETSFGVNWEIDWMKAHGKRVEYVQ